MAINLNTCCVSGNLTRDSELKITPAGNQVLHFTVACNESRKKPDGSWEDIPNYFDCVTFGNRAEKIAGYLVKGIKVAVQGRLKWSSWEKDGQRRSKVEIIADQIDIMQRVDQQGRSQVSQSSVYATQTAQVGTTYAAPTYSAPQPTYSAPAAYVQPAPTAPTVAEFDDSIPF